MLSRRLLTVTLASLMLLAQLLLAWHLPSHLSSHLSSHLQNHQAEIAAVLQADQHDNKEQNDGPCALGVNGHGVALAANVSLHNSTPAQAPRCAYYSAHYTFIDHLHYHARGPPLHS